MKDLPVPKDGESYFITLHPAYLEKSEFNTVSVDTNSDDYKELRKSIELNGVKDPVLTRINPKGGLEILSGQRRHMIARELNYPVPAIIQKNRRQRRDDPRCGQQSASTAYFHIRSFADAAQ